MKPTFEYHVHGARCGHASDAKDEEYVKVAISLGIKKLGFSAHLPTYPNPNITHNPISRMHYDQKEKYLASIKKLKNKYQDQIEIIVGYEAEYSSNLLHYLIKSRTEVDYMLLGAHSTHSGYQIYERGEPLKYAKIVCDGIETGLYDIVVHPDAFLIHRERVTNKTKFLEEAVIASTMICEKAKEFNIPLEINHNGILNSRGKVFTDNKLGYPHPLFWDIAAEVGNLVMWGVDAHCPSRLSDYEESINIIEKDIDTKQLNFVSEDYHPVIARSKNEKLKLALINTRNKVYSEESN